MSPGIVRWGVAAAAVLGVLHATAILWNPVAGLPQALIFFAAAAGLHRGRAWAGYGAALCLAAIVLGVAVNPLDAPGESRFVLAMAAVYGVPGLLLAASGRALGPVPMRAGVRWIALAAATFVFAGMFRPFVVPVGSMEDTLLAGDHVLVQTAGFGAADRGELVVIRPPGRPDNLFIKRVVAVGGDRVKIRDKKLFVNDVPQSEPYARYKTEYSASLRDRFPDEPVFPAVEASWAATLRSSATTGEVTVPEGHVFVLGDNRDNSLDSRFFGFVPCEDVVAKPRLISFSARESRERDPVLLKPGSVRWSRIFQRL
jgi:signal peptidase I